MQKFVHVIADYAPGDLACSEVISALAGQLPENFHWHFTSIHSFDTISTGFTTAQLALQDEELRPKEMIIYANCAPRKDRREARANNEGEGFVYGVVKNGVKVLVVNAGYSLSFLRDELQELWSVHIDRSGSQFRSRDYFPAIVGMAAKNNFDFLKEKLDPLKVIQERPISCIAYVDSFGNLKTTFRDGDKEVSALRPGARMNVTVNGVTMTATVAAGSFNVQEGDIAFAPGSSGHSKKYWEIFQRGGSAWHTFKKPRPGAKIEITPLED